MKDPPDGDVCTNQEYKVVASEIQEEIKKRSEETKADSLDCLPRSQAILDHSESILAMGQRIGGGKDRRCSSHGKIRSRT